MYIVPKSVRQLGYLSILNGIHVIFLLLITIVALRILGATPYGHVIILQAVVLTTSAFCIPPSNYLIQGYSDSKTQATTIQSSKISTEQFWLYADHLFLSIAVIFSSIIYITYSDNFFDPTSVFLVALGTSLNQLSACIGSLRVIGEHATIAWSQLFQSALRLLLLTAVALGFEIAIHWIFFVPDFLKYIFLLWRLKNKKGFTFQSNFLTNLPDRSECAALVWLMASKIADLPVQVADKLFIGSSISEAAAAYVHVARRSWILFSLIPETIHQKYLTKILQSQHTKKENVLKFISIFSVLYFLLCVFICIAALFSSNLWIGLIFEDDINKSYILSFQLMLFVGAFAASSILLHPLFLSICGAKINLMILVVVNLSYLALLYSIPGNLIYYVLILALQVLAIVIIKILLITKNISSK